MTSSIYILLFRGVGGATQLPVKPLSASLEAAGFDAVRTYINSGNAILRTGKSRDAMLKEVTKICARDFAFTKAIHAVTLVEWRNLIRDNPFSDAVDVPKNLSAALLAETPQAANVEKITAAAVQGERFEIVGRVAYLHTPYGFGTSKMAIKFDKAIGVENTTRNWNTVLRLLELAEAAEG
ncbi:DUF1697 domain-containing protein [Mesorhizobium sp. NBSH29]|uniref:DUF1697 domain-containing protein n=1 Tax=Mesorhizobium sp. NBSH29 TaxID=2654249 RepID=UPI0018968AB9|nr:DUF1697 domain-containing protein [Mesorhizobium sp. NBSH29]QPC87527.1 DUF1697 domain-containing protein [Mesorhizobium sp. NBSH29]